VRSLWDRLRHAFAIAPPGAFQPTPSQREVIERLVELARERGLRAPAVLFLDSVTPLHGVAAQVLQFFQPLGDLLGVDRGWQELVAVLEQPGGCEYVLQRLEGGEVPGAPSEAALRGQASDQSVPQVPGAEPLGEAAGQAAGVSQEPP
jgi:hypothetical protein